MGVRVNKYMKSAIAAMLKDKRPDEEIAKLCKVSRRQIQRYKANIKVNGEPFPKTKSCFNAAKIKTQHKEALLKALNENPEWSLEQMQQFLAKEHKITVHQSTLSRFCKRHWNERKAELLGPDFRTARRDSAITKSAAHLAMSPPPRAPFPTTTQVLLPPTVPVVQVPPSAAAAVQQQQIETLPHWHHQVFETYPPPPQPAHLQQVAHHQVQHQHSGIRGMV